MQFGMLLTDVEELISDIIFLPSSPPDYLRDPDKADLESLATTVPLFDDDHDDD